MRLSIRAGCATLGLRFLTSSGGLSEDLYHSVAIGLNEMMGEKCLAHTKTTKNGVVTICHSSMLTSVLGTEETKLNKTWPVHFCRL